MEKLTTQSTLNVKCAAGSVMFWTHMADNGTDTLSNKRNADVKVKYPWQLRLESVT